VAGGLDEVFDERCDERPRCARSGSGGEQVEGAVVGEKVDGIEVLARLRGYRVEHARVGEAGKRERDAHPDGVAGARV
jgi:hypothetical protein